MVSERQRLSECLQRRYEIRWHRGSGAIPKSVKGDLNYMRQLCALLGIVRGGLTVTMIAKEFVGGSDTNWNLRSRHFRNVLIWTGTRTGTEISLLAIEATGALDVPIFAFFQRSARIKVLPYASTSCAPFPRLLKIQLNVLSVLAPHKKAPPIELSICLY